ncbi:MAG: dihydroorotase family protein [Candidatus Bathyarchaeota archaeon]|nr:dihydroorotase family protein [Candidatus Bathyarchaeota archaeon]MDI6805100.1 dihydroorotase family protein [Candidatus Bathyarchaeia archaeon]
MTVDLVLGNAKVYINKKIVECSIAIEYGKIYKVGKEAVMPKADKKMDLKNLLVLPGLIDVHTHLRDEGKAYKEDFYSGTAAAAAGGITTVLDMPNNDPVTMSVEALRGRMKVAEKKILVNVGFYSEFPEKTDEIHAIIKAGAVAFKLFMMDQMGGLNIDDDKALLEAFEAVAKLKTLVAVHAEDKRTIEKAEEKFKQSNRNDIEAFLKAHSENAEWKTVKRLLNIVKQTHAHIHFCHVSTKKGLETIREGKNLGLPISCEATPHHMFLSVKDLRKIGTLTLTLPPIRNRKSVSAILDGIKNGWIDILASDHAPHTLAEKNAENVWNVKVGIPGLETTLPLLLTEVNRGRLSMTDVVKLMAEKPAETFKLKGRGYLENGNIADLTVVDLKKEDKIDASKFHSKAKFSPFDGWKVKGKPVKTFVKGQLVMDEGEIVAEAGSGEIIRRK